MKSGIRKSYATQRRAYFVCSVEIWHLPEIWIFGIIWLFFRPRNKLKSRIFINPACSTDAILHVIFRIVRKSGILIVRIENQSRPQNIMFILCTKLDHFSNFTLCTICKISWNNMCTILFLQRKQPTSIAVPNQGISTQIVKTFKLFLPRKMKNRNFRLRTQKIKILDAKNQK